MCIFQHGLSALDMCIFRHEPSALDMSIFQHRLFGVVVIQRSMVDEWGVHLQYVKVMKCSGVAEICGWLRGVHLPWVYVHSLFLHRMLDMSVFLHMLYCNWFGVVVFQIYGWLRGHSAMGRCAFCLYETYLV